MATETLYFNEAVLISETKRYETIPCGSTFDGTSGSLKDANLVMKAEDYNKENRYKEIIDAKLYLYLEPGNFSSGYAKVIDCYCDSFDIYSLNAFNDPFHVNAWKGWQHSSIKSGKYIAFKVYDTTNNVWASIVNGVWFYPPTDFNQDYWNVQTPLGTNRPYMIIQYGETVGINAVSHKFPTSGSNILKSNENTFIWEIDSPNPLSPTAYYDYGPRKTIERIEVVSTKLRWKYVGETTYQELNLGSTTSYTFPANTFSKNGKIEWQVSVTSNSGIETTSEWETATVGDVISDAKVVYPERVSLNGSVPNVFSWEHIISTGSAQSGFDLQTSKDADTWEDLISGETAENSVTIAGNMLLGGTLYWRVRTYNSDRVPGNWSEPAQIYVVAAPDAPVVAVASTDPKFSIRWQQAGQQAYEIKLNGVQIAKTYSLESSYTYHGYLDPGDYLVQVRIQNETGLWSDWGSSPLPISNQEGDQIELIASGENPVVLTWDTNGSYASFVIYRNGEKIAQTDQRVFTDHFAIGAVSYQVRGIFADSGYYTLSNEAVAQVSVPCIMISPVQNPAWNNLRLSASSLRRVNQAASHSVTYVQYVGDKLPSAEIGDSASMTLDLDCAFLTRDTESWKAFESLLGKMVCVKHPNGERFIGILDQYSKETMSNMYIIYNATVTIVSWKEWYS